MTVSAQEIIIILEHNGGDNIGWNCEELGRANEPGALSLAVLVT